MGRSCPDRDDPRRDLRELVLADLVELLGLVRSVDFDLDRAGVTGEGRTLLDRLAAVLHEYPSIRLEIVGRVSAFSPDAEAVLLSVGGPAAIAWHLFGA